MDLGPGRLPARPPTPPESPQLVAWQELQFRLETTAQERNVTPKIAPATPDYQACYCRSLYTPQGYRDHRCSKGHERTCSGHVERCERPSNAVHHLSTCPSITVPIRRNHQYLEG